MFDFTVLPDAGLRIPATPLPVISLIVCVYTHAVFVILLPKTRSLALALLPVTLWLAYYCAFRIDFAQWIATYLEPFGFKRDRLGYLNAFYMIAITVQTLRAIDWTTQCEPFRRLNPPEGDNPATERSTDLGTALSDAGDLCWNLRGIGWSWTRNCFPPPHEHGRPLPTLFALTVFEWILLDAIHASIQLRQPSLNRPAGDTLFDPSLAPLLRIAGACLTTVSAGAIILLGLDVSHRVLALVARAVFRDAAWRWPPLFAAPWCATSLADFWARWHQLFRRQFTFFGNACARVLRIDRRAGTLLGAFMFSGVLHDLGTWAMRADGGGAEPLSVSAFFVLMGLGVVVEQAWRPRGVLGWCWTFSWTVGWATRWMDAWTRRGLVASMFCPEDLRPGKYLVKLLWRVISGIEL